jgi:hypothetical protein
LNNTIGFVFRDIINYCFSILDLSIKIRQAAISLAKLFFDCAGVVDTAVLNAITRRDIFYIAWASLPFFVLMLLALAMFTYFPQIVMVVPDWYGQ